MSATIELKHITCEGCQCGEIFSVRCVSAVTDCDPELLLGYQKIHVGTLWGAWVPYICPRCQNNLTELDHLKIAVRLEVGNSYGMLKATELVSRFPDFKEADVNEVAYKLIEASIIQVDAKGILSPVKGD